MKTPGVYGRAVALVLGVALPPVIALGAILVEQNQHALRVDADQTHVLLAELAAVIVEKEVAEAQRVVESIAETALKPENGTTEAENMASLSRVFAEHSALLAVTLYDANGARRATLRPEGDGTEGPQTLPEALRGDAPRLVRVGPGAVGLAVPAEQGWAYGAVDFSAVTEQLRRFGLRPPLRAADAVSLVDGAGRLLAGETTDTAAVMSALGDDPGFVTKPLSIATEFERDDQAMLGAVVTLPRLGWAVVVQRPRAQAYESLRELRAAVAAAVLLSVLLATVATLFAVRRLTHPIALLTRATRELAERRFSAVDPHVLRRQDELGALGRSFADMAVALANAEQATLEEARVRAAFSRFLAPPLVDRLVHEPDALKLGGERKRVTVMFADVVGFAKLSEALPPETVVALLNELFTFATEIVHRRGGMIDKFIGDAVMAVWGIPDAKADDTEQAVAAAEELRRWLETGNRRWRQKWGIEISLGIGIHSGDAVAGNIGSTRRMDYTVIGEAVNVAARLEAAAEPGQILISDSTRLALSNTTTADLRAVAAPLRLRGATTEVFEVGP